MEDVKKKTAARGISSEKRGARWRKRTREVGQILKEDEKALGKTNGWGGGILRMQNEGCVTLGSGFGRNQKEKESRKTHCP